MVVDARDQSRIYDSDGSMRIKCPCQGFNENCYRCFGKGYYDDQKHSRLKKFKRSKVSKTIAKMRSKTAFMVSPDKELKVNRIKKYSFIKCPECSVSVRNDRIENHVQRVHHTYYAKNTFILPSEKRKSTKSDEIQPHAEKPFNNTIATNSNGQSIPIAVKPSVTLSKNTDAILRKKIASNKTSREKRLLVNTVETRIIKSLDKNEVRVINNNDLYRYQKKSDVQISVGGHNINFNYKLLFEKIESSLMHNLSIHPDDFIRRISPFKETKHWDFRNRTNKNIFWVLSYIIFFGQNDPAYLIEGQFDIINKELCDGSKDRWIEWEVDFDRLSNLSIPEKNQ